MRRSGAGGTGGGDLRPAVGVVVAPAVGTALLTGGDEGVRVVAPASSATVLGVWAVSRGGEVLPGARFDGEGAEARATAYAEWVRVEIRAGRFGARVAKGTCSLGNPCDRDRVHVFRLSDLSAETAARLVLCPEHRARLAEETPPPPPAPTGRRRKAPPS